ncbi:MAG: LCP family protein [Acidimicrobiales bacterium]
MSDEPSPSPDAKRGTAAASGRDERKFFVGPESIGTTPPPSAPPPPVAAPPEEPVAPVMSSVAIASPPAVERADGNGAGAPSKVYVAEPGAPPPRRSMLDGDRAAKSSGGGSGRALKPPKQRKDRPPRRHKVRRRILQIAAVIILVPLILLGAGLVYAQWKFSQIERVEVAEVLDVGGGNGQNILLVGSDAGADRSGQRSDTIMLLRLEPEGAKVMSIPRDLFVTIVPSGGEQRINAAYNDGPASLIQTVQDSLGIPVHRYMEVDFVTFASLVDAIGGVTIEFPHPAFDEKAGLAIDQTGPVLLNGDQALAFVRSRTYTEIIDGRQVVDPTSDLGRVQRQQLFMRTVFAKIGESRNPLDLMRVATSVVGGLRIDDDMSLLDAVRLGLRMRSLDPAPVVLPAEPFRLGTGAQVLRLDEDLAPAALDQFR